MNLLSKTRLNEKFETYIKISAEFKKNMIPNDVVIPALFVNILGKDVNTQTVNEILGEMNSIEEKLLKDFIKLPLNEHFSYEYNDRQDGKQNITNFISAMENYARFQSEYFGVIHIDVTDVNVFNEEIQYDFELFLDFLEENKNMHWYISFYALNMDYDRQIIMNKLIQEYIFTDFEEIKLNELTKNIKNNMFEKYNINLSKMSSKQMNQIMKSYDKENIVNLTCSSPVIQELAYNLVKDIIVDKKHTDYEDMQEYINNAYIKNKSDGNEKKMIGFVGN